MARAKKDGHFLNCYIKQNLWDAIEKHSEETMLPKTAIVEKALEDYFKKNRTVGAQDFSNEKDRKL